MSKPSLVLEIILQASQLSMSLFEQNELASTVKHYSQRSVNFREIDKLCQEVVAILNEANRTSPKSSDAIDSLKKTGHLLWEHLLTKAVKDSLKSAVLKDLILSLDEELIDIPWELLHSGEDFLSLKYNLGRLVRTKQAATPLQYRAKAGRLKMLVLANPTNDLKSAYQEGLNIKNQLDKKRKDLEVNFKSTHIDMLYLKKNLGDYDIVHFAGHCEYDEANPKKTGWLLSDGMFTVSDILTLGEGGALPALIFSNACHSAKVKDALTPGDYQRKAYSLAEAFLFSGVRHYIGTIWKIEDRVSLVFGQQFYNHLIMGSSVGEAIRLSRLRLIKEFGITGLFWANYLLYGDPNLVMFFTLHKEKPQAFFLALAKTTKKFRKLITKAGFPAVILGALAISLYIWLPTINPSTYFLFNRSRQLFSKGANQEAIYFSQKIIKKEPGFLPVYPLLADTYLRLGKREEALRSYFDFAVYSEKKLDKKSLASAYIGTAWVYQAKGQYPKAFDFYNKAIALTRETQDKLNLAIALRRLAVWYIDKEDNNRALELLLKSSEINRERSFLSEYRYNLACDYFDLGLVFINKDDYPTAKEFYVKSYNLFNKMKLKGELSDYYFNLGEIYIFEKKFQAALDCYLKGLKVDEEQGNLPSLASDYAMLGELYLEMDDLKAAEGYLLKAVYLAKKIDSGQELASAYYDLGSLYKKTNQKNKAKEYLRMAEEIYYSIDLPNYQNIKQEILGLSNTP